MRRSPPSAERSSAGSRATSSELETSLAERWPEHDAHALAMVIRAHVPLIQIPPRGLWRQSGRPVVVPAESWLGRPLAARPSLERMLLRYLAAFGPASVQDAQVWSGLTRLREVVERLRPELRSFRDENGVELLDVPDGAAARSRDAGAAALPPRVRQRAPLPRRPVARARRARTLRGSSQRAASSSTASSPAAGAEKRERKRPKLELEALPLDWTRAERGPWTRRASACWGSSWDPNRY